MTRWVFVLAFLLGAAAVVMMGMNFLESDVLALTVTVVIGAVYAIGAIELLQFRRATASLNRSLAELTGEVADKLKALDEWLIKLHPSLHNPVRRRIEGDRLALPAPVLTPYLVSLLVMLGLLGTFVGLVETLKGVVVALEGSSELESIRRSLTAPMAGLELAFGTSVAGVAASAMLGLMSTLSRRERVLSSRRLDNKAGKFLRRFSLTHQHRETLEALQLQSRALPAIVEKLDLLADRMARNSDELGGRLVANQEGFHDSVKTLYGELAASVDRSLQDSLAKSDRLLAESGRLVGEGIRPIVQEAMTNVSAEVRRGVEESHQQLGQTVRDQLQGLSGHFSRTSEEVAHAWRDGLAAHERSNDSLVQGMRESFDAFSDRFGRASDEVLQSIRAGNADWIGQLKAGEQARVERWTDALQQSREQADSRLQAVTDAIIGELKTVAERQQDSFKSLGDDAAGLATELTARLRESGEQAVARQQEMAAALDETARSMADHNQSSAERMLSEIGRLLNTSEALVNARVETEAAWLEGHEQRMRQLTDHLRDELAGLRQDEAQRGQAAVDRLAELESRVSDHLGSLGKALEEPMAHLIELASETPRAAAEVIGQLRQEISNNLERDNRQLEERTRLMAQLDAVTESLAKSSAGQVAAIQTLVDSSSRMLEQTGERFAGQVGGEIAKVSEMAEQFGVSAAEISSLGEAFKAAVDQYGDANGRLIEGLERIEGALEKSNARSDEQLGYYVAQAREVIDYNVLTQKEIFDELRQLKLGGTASPDAAEVN